MDILNKVMMIGNLAADPEVRATGNGTKVADFRLALSGAGVGEARGADGEPGAAFVDVTVWERQAELVEEYLHKGSQILVEGRLQQDAWRDKDSGQTRRKLKVVGQRIRFLGKKEDDGAPPDTDRQPASRPRRQPRRQTASVG